MNAFFTSGAFVDVALVVLALEAVALLALGRRGATRLGPLDLFGQLAAGAMLMLALRCAVSGADPRLTLAFFGASFPAHVFDLVRRVRRPADG